MEYQKISMNFYKPLTRGDMKSQFIMRYPLSWGRLKKEFKGLLKNNCTRKYGANILPVFDVTVSMS